MKEKTLGKTLKELEETCLKLHLPKFTAKQIADWMYKKGVVDIDSMTNLSLKARQALSESYEVGIVKPLKEALSEDGTIKYLYQYGENAFVESVLIPDKKPPHFYFYFHKKAKSGFLVRYAKYF